MAQVVTLVDDVDRCSQAERTVPFGLGGKEYEIDLTAEDQRDYYYCQDAVIEMLNRQSIEDCGEQPESWHIRISPWGQMLVTPGMVDKSKWRFSTHPGDPDPVRAS